MSAGRLYACVLFAVAILFPPVSAADVVTEWNQKAGASVLEAKILPFAGTRVMAIVHTAMFDAINSIEPRYTPYKFKVSASAGSSPEAAGVAAAHATLVILFPEQKSALDAAYAASLAQIPDGTGKAAGIGVGEEVAAKVLAWRASDGANAPNTYRPVTTPGTYITTTLPVGTQWIAMTPWVMERPSQFHPAPPPALSSAEWTADYNEVKELGGKKSARRTSEQTEMARFWTITGPQSFDPVVRQLAGNPGRSLSQNARLFALVEIAVADSYIAVFEAKYTYNFWRPITAIRNGDIDGNEATARDPGWEPLIDTPLHPEYPCAHCINSGAARAVLESEFGTGPNPLTMTSQTAPGVVHKWASIADYAEEVSLARICGGLHYRNSTVVGKAMGKKIGELAVQNYLRPVQ
jgi:PAP2 superfamily